MSRIDRIKERFEATTQAEWFFNGYSRVDRADYDEDWGDDYKDWYICEGPIISGDTGTKQCMDNMQFIACAHQDIPWLIDRLEKAIGFLKKGKAKFAPNTTNSEVDVFLSEFKESNS